jgi:beta-galactosidase
MQFPWHLSAVMILVLALMAIPAACLGQSTVPLPQGVTAVWDLAKAQREATPTRERVCVNGLWRWQPAAMPADAPTAGAAGDAVPTGNWGYLKVPACWPGITTYQQKDSQRVFAHPSWKDQKLSSITSAWYQREITIPQDWAHRPITLSAEYLNSFATVYLDGKKVGDLHFPAGEVDLTSVCRPGATHVLSMLVTAMPLQGVMLSYVDSASAREVKGSVERRGLCGDVYLVAAPAAGIADVRVDTSVRKWEITFTSELKGLAADTQYALRARITDAGRNVVQFTSKPFTAADLTDGRFTFTAPWKPEKLWDTITPGNTYDLQFSLVDTAGKPLDTAWTSRFGFREFWIDGRDFYLNGSRIYLSCVPLDNAQVSVAQSTYQATRESLQRLKSFGINFVYTHNYGCEPGSHLGFSEILRAADDEGMLVSFSQPHFSHYDWKAADADKTNGYARHAAFYVHAAGNHPSIVFYSMSHNGTGYSQDMNPDMIDGVQDPREQWSSNNTRLAMRAQAIVNQLDPSRIVYHHASGNLGVMHDSNFYPNFVPVQELSDWFGHWAAKGVKPAFTCEFGAPFTWDWTMYRGWYKGKREFGSAAVPWEFCLAEWNSQFVGDRAFAISEPEKTDLRWEAKQFRAGKLWHRWDYPVEVGSTRFEEREEVFAKYITDNFRAFRTLGLSANSPWDHGPYWKLRDGVNRSRKELAVDWDNLQRPGFSPDYIDDQYQIMEMAFDRSDWIPTAAAQALIRNNSPLLAYIAGKPSAVTSKDHNFRPGQVVEKQLIVINNSRQTVTCDCQWLLGLPKALAGGKRITLATGEQIRIPLRFDLPATLPPGKYELTATVAFGNNSAQTDAFTIDVLPPVPAAPTLPTLALFDPAGETTAWLTTVGVPFQKVDANADLSPFDTLIVGKNALTVDGPAPDITRVRDGLKVILFEQTSAVLEKRFGFRVEEYGLRDVYPRIADHPLLAGIEARQLHDWCGQATILPPQLRYESDPRLGTTVKWCDIKVTRLWRCGNRGNVASVLIEKPARGDFRPILDGGFSLQYSPLMEYREGSGMILFCQLDVTGRTEPDPAADTLTRNLLRYASTWQPSPTRTAVYAGEPAGKAHLESAGIAVTSYAGGSLRPDQVLVLGPGAGGSQELAANAPAIADWLKTGGHLLALGLDQQGADTLLPFKLTLKKAEHIAATFTPFTAQSPLAGVGPADVHNRDPRQLPLVSAGATIIGDGVLAQSKDANIIICQLAPWQFDYHNNYGLKRTYRRTSFLVNRLLAGQGVSGSTPILTRFSSPVAAAKPEKRWLDGLYLDQPEEWDDPYRFFRW